MQPPIYKNASLDPHLAVRASECLPAYPLKSLLQSLMSPLYSRNERDGPTGGPGRRADRPVQPTGRPARTYVLSQHRRGRTGAGLGRQGRVMRTRKLWMTGTALALAGL